MNIDHTKTHPSLREQETFYDHYWATLLPFSSRKITRLSKIMEYLSRVRKSIKKPEILDLGCGDGRSVSVWNLFGNATGFDLSEKAILNAKLQFPAINFIAGDATHTTFSDQSFDVVISHEVIEHLENQSQYLAECSRLLKNGGFLILTTPNKYYFDHFSKGNYSKQPIEKIMSPKTLRSMIEKHFLILESESVVAGIADRGVYRFLTNKFFIAIATKLKFEFIRIQLINKQMLGVHQAIFAQKK